jgi:hypothetical protein
MLLPKIYLSSKVIIGFPFLEAISSVAITPQTKVSQSCLALLNLE